MSQRPLKLLATLLTLNTSKNEGNYKVSVWFLGLHPFSKRCSQWIQPQHGEMQQDQSNTPYRSRKASAIWKGIRHDPSSPFLPGGFHSLLQSCQFFGCHTDNNQETLQYVFIWTFSVPICLMRIHQLVQVPALVPLLLGLCLWYSPGFILASLELTQE